MASGTSTLPTAPPANVEVPEATSYVLVDVNTGNVLAGYNERLRVPLEQPQRAMSGGGAPKTPHTGDGSNQAMTGNGSDAEDARPAFPTYSPRPPVTDRALLPTSEVKIVVDVDLDALGQVVHETLVKGMGTRLDQIVLETVKTWRFQPATVNGKPVPSEDELIFPFNPSYPITDS